MPTKWTNTHQVEDAGGVDEVNLQDAKNRYNDRAYERMSAKESWMAMVFNDLLAPKKRRDNGTQDLDEIIEKSKIEQEKDQRAVRAINDAVYQRGD